ncbi:MAG: hypothetical protein LBN74_10470 [Prevotella sp.]|nr:hypothetical protein [Prevotella sp.]
MLLICFCSTVFAQDSTNTVVATEQKQEVFRIPAQSKIEKYQKDSRFQYKKEERDISWWDKFWYRVNDFIDNMFHAAADSGMLSVIVVLILVLVVALIVLKLLGVNYKTLLGKKKLDTSEIDIYTENVHNMNFDELIANALKNKDYRLTVRFLYLKNLKLMSDKEIIEWNTTKTNYSYLYEIKNDSLRKKFSETTYIFDYVWYGEFALNDSLFSDIHSRMNEFNNMVSHER